MTKFFTGSYATLEELKKAYRDLALKNHPDCGGTNEAMKLINAEYEDLFKRIERGLSEDDAKKNYHKLDDGYREIIEKLITMPLIIELVGSWLWVSGQTYTYAPQLREYGLQFSKSKKMWYWYSGDMSKKRRSSKKSYDEIKAHYGCERVDNSVYLIA
jgi:curved DNA-binding protein CbpA